MKSEELGLNPGSGSFNSCDTFDFRQNTNHLNPGCTCKHLGTKSELNNSLEWTSSDVLIRDQLFVTPWTVCSPPGSSVHGILPARILECDAISSSRGSSRPRNRTCVSYISCTGRRTLYHKRHLGRPWMNQRGVISVSELPLQVSKSFSSYQLCFGVFCGLSGITSALPHHRTWLTCPWPDTPLPISSLYPSHPAV